MVFEGLEPLYARNRIDSRANTEQLIKNAMNAVQARAAARGVSIDPEALPGTKEEFVRIIVGLEPRLSRFAAATLIEYVKHMGYRWLRGTRNGQLRSLLGM